MARGSLEPALWHVDPRRATCLVCILPVMRVLPLALLVALEVAVVACGSSSSHGNGSGGQGGAGSTGTATGGDAGMNDDGPGLDFDANHGAVTGLAISPATATITVSDPTKPPTKALSAV